MNNIEMKSKMKKEEILKRFKVTYNVLSVIEMP
jgi:hypothetical protein